MRTILKKIFAGISGFTFLFTSMIPVFASASKPNMIRYSVAKEIKYILGSAYNYGVVAQNVNIVTDLESNVFYYEGNLDNINKGIPDYVNNTFKAASDEIIPFVLEGISNRVSEYYSENDIDIYNNYYEHNKINIDTTKIETDIVTLIWDASKIGGIAGENVTIYKNDNQLLIIKIVNIFSSWYNAISSTNGIKVNNVSAPAYIHGYDGNYFASITSSLVFDFCDYAGTINLQEVGGIVIAPKASIVQSATCCGWVAANNYSNNGGEWHFPLLRDEAEEETTTEEETETSSIEETAPMTEEETTLKEEITTTIPQTEIVTTEEQYTTTVIEETTTLFIEETTITETIPVEETTTIIEETTTENEITTVVETSSTISHETETERVENETTSKEEENETSSIGIETEEESTTENVTSPTEEVTTEMETTTLQEEITTTVEDTTLTEEELTTSKHKKGEVEADVSAGEINFVRYLIMILSLIVCVCLTTNIVLSSKKKNC